MPLKKSTLLNLGLAAFSVTVVIVMTAVADRVFGTMQPKPELPVAAELAFPPHSEHAYRTHDFEYTVRINAHGIRERDLPVHGPDAYRVVVVGDSFTYGWGVNAEDTWVRRLEENLRAKGYDVEVLNLGKPGAGPDFYASLAREAIPVLRPDLVVVGMLQNNDLASANPEGLSQLGDHALRPVRWLYPNTIRWLAERALPEDDERTSLDMPPQVTNAENNQQWTRTTAQHFLDAMSEEERARYDGLDPVARAAFEDGLLNPFMVDLAIKNPRFYVHMLEPDAQWIQDAIQRTGLYLHEIGQVAATYGARTVVVSVPDGPYVNREAWENIQRVGYEVEPEALTSAALDDAIAAASARARLPFLTVTDQFRAEIDTPGLFFELDGHLSADGHRLYGDLITPLLEPFAAQAPRLKGANS